MRAKSLRNNFLQDRCCAARALLFCEASRCPPFPDLQEYVMADKKKPSVKELPAKAVPSKDADKVKGGLRVREF
jgi:hypothetical protein